MKINLALRQGDGEIIFHEVRATMPFQVFGYTFGAHPRVNPDGTFKNPKKYGWVVTEASLGAIPVQVLGRESFNQRLKDESENSFAPKPRVDQEQSFPPESDMKVQSAKEI